MIIKLFLFFCRLVRVKLQQHLNKRLAFMARIGSQRYMSWAPKKKAVVLLDLCHERHTLKKKQGAILSQKGFRGLKNSFVHSTEPDKISIF